MWRKKKQRVIVNRLSQLHIMDNPHTHTRVAKRQRSSSERADLIRKQSLKIKVLNVELKHSRNDRVGPDFEVGRMSN